MTDLWVQLRVSATATTIQDPNAPVAAVVNTTPATATAAPPGARTLADLSDIERDLIRQGERTVDNLKRLFAFVFSLSFAAVAAGASAKLQPVLTGTRHSPPLSVWFLNGEMLLVFVVTAGVFFHQSAKFLDNRYARHPLSKAHPFGFAWDYFIQVATVAPFFFMAFAFAPSVTREVGYLGFFGFYVVLLSSGLVLLLLAALRHSNWVRNRIAETIAVQELEREDVIRTYWIFMNSSVLFVILLVFQIFRRSGILCPSSPAFGELISGFLVIFGIIALIRDF